MTIIAMLSGVKITKVHICKPEIVSNDMLIVDKLYHKANKLEKKVSLF